MPRAEPVVNYTCPHCGRDVSTVQASTKIDQSEQGAGSSEGSFFADHSVCPNCKRSQIKLGPYRWFPGGREQLREPSVVWPVGGAARLIPKEVPADLATDYREAAAVLAISPKASAALSRRILQAVLLNQLAAKGHNLSQQIQSVLDSNQLPTGVADSIDAVRNIGNFAAHEMKSEHTGEIVPVEPQEAEWTLEVLDLLFDHVFVQPALAVEKRAALNKKLQEAGKPELKGSK